MRKRWRSAASPLRKNAGSRSACAGLAAGKAEGLALIDSKTLAVANDNDFGVKVAMQKPVEGKKLKDYRVNAQGR